MTTTVGEREPNTPPSTQSAATAESPTPTPTDAAPAAESLTEWAIARRIWPLLMVAAFSWLPSTALALLLVPIAQGIGVSVALVGGARGLGGVTALLGGIVALPLVDRYPRAWTIAGSLVVILVATLAPMVAGLPGLALYAIALGAAQAVLLPAVQAGAADEGSAQMRTRGAALVAACMSLGPMISGVLLPIPVTLFGWQGAFAMMAIVAAALAVVALTTLSSKPPVGVVSVSYFRTFPLILAAPGASALLLSGALRACGWFSMSAYLSALLAERFGFDTVQVGLIWSGNAAWIFVANLISGRISTSMRRGAEGVWIGGSIIMLIAGPASFLTNDATFAVAMTWAYAFGMGVTNAGMTALMVSRFVALRGAILGFNAAGTNLGVFAGAGLGALALATFSYPGVAVVVTTLILAATIASIWAIQSLNQAKT